MATFPSFSGTLGNTYRDRDNNPLSAGNIAGLRDQLQQKSKLDAILDSLSGKTAKPANPLAGITSVYQPMNLFGSPTIGGGGSYMNKFGTFQEALGSGNNLTTAAVANATSGKIGVDISGLNKSQIDSLRIKFGDKFLELSPEDALAVYTGGMGGSKLGPRPSGETLAAKGRVYQTSTDKFNKTFGKGDKVFDARSYFDKKQREGSGSGAGMTADDIYNYIAGGA